MVKTHLMERIFAYLSLICGLEREVVYRAGGFYHLIRLSLSKSKEHIFTIYTMHIVSEPLYDKQLSGKSITI